MLRPTIRPEVIINIVLPVKRECDNVGTEFDEQQYKKSKRMRLYVEHEESTFDRHPLSVVDIKCFCIDHTDIPKLDCRCALEQPSLQRTDEDAKSVNRDDHESHEYSEANREP